MERLVAMLGYVVLVVGILGAGPVVAVGQRPSVQPTARVAPGSARAPDGLTQAIQDTIAAHLAALELQRRELLATGRSPDHPDVLALDRRRAALRAQLTELPNAEAAQIAVNVQLVRGIEARLASLAVEHRLRALELPASHPDLQALVALEAALQRRRDELRSAIRAGRAQE